MADSLGRRNIVVDLTSVTKRQIQPGSFKIQAITVDGASGTGGPIGLKEDGTGGDVIWQYTPVATSNVHTMDTPSQAIIGQGGLYIAAPDSDANLSAAWGAGAKLIIHLA